MLYLFHVLFHTKVGKSNLSCSTDCTKHASAATVIHRQQIIIVLEITLVTDWALMKRQARLTI